MLNKQLIESEYARCVAVLQLADITLIFPQSKRIGLIGADGKEYPKPTSEQLIELISMSLADLGIACLFLQYSNKKDL